VCDRASPNFVIEALESIETLKYGKMLSRNAAGRANTRGRNGVSVSKHFRPTVDRHPAYCIYGLTATTGVHAAN